MYHLLVDLDKFLLDKVFQPIVDALGERMKHHRLALLMITVSFVGFVGLYIQLGYLIARVFPIMLFVPTLSFLFTVRLLAHDAIINFVVGRMLREGAMNPLRYHFHTRLSILIFSPFMIWAASSMPFFNYAVIACVAWVCAKYFMACQKNPPKTFMLFAPA